MDIFEKLKSLNINSPVGKPEWLIVGLGNPGSKYTTTRHNAGFLTIDYISEKNNISVDKLKYKSLCGIGMVNSKCVMLMKPQTFMNNSGEAVVEAMNFYKIPIENVIVIYDDISLDVSKLRIRRKGTHGGHNGIKSIIALTGKDSFPRVKVGVGKKPNPNWDLADWVLSNFTTDEMDSLKLAIEKAKVATEFIVGGDIDQAMNKCN